MQFGKFSTYESRNVEEVEREEKKNVVFVFHQRRIIGCISPGHREDA